MTAVVFLIEQTAVGLYILIGLGVLVFVRRWGRARQNYRATHFELEREIFRYKSANALTFIILLAEAALIVLGVQQVVAPTIRDAERASGGFDQRVEALTDGITLSPTPPQVNFGVPPIDASGVQIGEQEIVQVVATPTLTPTPVGTILPNPPPISGCDKPNATLQVPANGMLVFEPVNVLGTAYTDDFAFYRFELNGPQTFGSFAIIRDYDQPVSELGELGQFVPSFYQPGEYQFRLTVFDITNTLRAACTINITISEPIPTPTPLQQ
ncbi:MAG: hypothetical protein K8I30_01755 [Anaerolineae bacterium]|nr:hypothetical protein [Anaerolineae bacterium]